MTKMTAAGEGTNQPHQGQAKAGSPYRWYVLAVLTTVYAFSVVDRNYLSLLQEPIKKDLSLSDAQLGALTGLAFAAFYATLAIPVARFSERNSRKIVVGLAIGLWSTMTFMCGLAMSFPMLLLARMGVGVGEAGGYPPSASIISDYFAADRRATALAVFGLGPPVGSVFGLVLGGWLNAIAGWRVAFFVIAAIGLVVSPLVLFTVREPQKGASDIGGAALGATEAPRFSAVARVLWGLKSYRLLLFANVLHCFSLYAYNAWSPPFYGRVFHLPTDKIGLALGSLSAVGALGTFCGGWLSDRLGRRGDRRWYAWVPGLASFLVIFPAAVQFFAPTPVISFSAAVFPAFLFLVWVGPTIALGQSLVSPQIRATSAAITLAACNIFGLGLGPLCVGLLSDHLHKLGMTSPEALRWSIMAAVLAEMGAAVLYFMSGRHLERDLRRDRRQDFA